MTFRSCSLWIPILFYYFSPNTVVSILKGQILILLFPLHISKLSGYFHIALLPLLLFSSPPNLISSVNFINRLFTSFSSLMQQLHKTGQILILAAPKPIPQLDTFPFIAYQYIFIIFQPVLNPYDPAYTQDNLNCVQMSWNIASKPSLNLRNTTYIMFIFSFNDISFKKSHFSD